MSWVAILIMSWVYALCLLWCSNPGHPFAAGITLERLSAVTVDENGKETFVTGGAVDRIQKVPCYHTI